MRVESGSWWSRLGDLVAGQTRTGQREAELRRALADAESPDVQVRRSAAWRLGKLREDSDEVKAAMDKLLNDSNEYVRRSAKWAAKQIEAA